MMKINYSIIIPHKNIPHLLVRCLNSIPFREDVQVIVVDDNSDDQYKADLTALTSLYPNVEFVFGKHENGRKGAGYARNLGLERAKGKYIVFADADDFFMPCFDDTMNKFAETDIDLIAFCITCRDSDNLEQECDSHYNELLFAEPDFNNSCLTTYCVWSHFINREMLVKNYIDFQEVEYSNDVLFHLKIYYYASSKQRSDTIIYCHTKRKGSLVATITIDALYVRFKVSLDCIKFCRKFYKREKGFYGALQWIEEINKIDTFAAVQAFFEMLKVCKIKSIPFLANVILKKWVLGRHSPKKKV